MADLEGTRAEKERAHTELAYLKVLDTAVNMLCCAQKEQVMSAGVEQLRGKPAWRD